MFLSLTINQNICLCCLDLDLFFCNLSTAACRDFSKLFILFEQDTLWFDLHNTLSENTNMMHSYGSHCSYMYITNHSPPANNPGGIHSYVTQDASRCDSIRFMTHTKSYSSLSACKWD